jgi:hypothetical protein
MNKQISFVITAAIMLTAFVTVALYTGNEAKAQGNTTAAAGANMTKGNMTKGNMSTAGKAMVIGAMNKTK